MVHTQGVAVVDTYSGGSPRARVGRPVPGAAGKAERQACCGAGAAAIRSAASR